MTRERWVESLESEGVLTHLQTDLWSFQFQKVQSNEAQTYMSRLGELDREKRAAPFGRAGRWEQEHWVCRPVTTSGTREIKQSSWQMAPPHCLLGQVIENLSLFFLLLNAPVDIRESHPVPAVSAINWIQDTDEDPWWRNRRQFAGVMSFYWMIKYFV